MNKLTVTRRPILNHLLRFCRRLREHGLPEAIIVRPANADIRDTDCFIIVGSRVAIIDATGEVRPCLRPVRGVYDRHALLAHRNRWHAVWIDNAGDCRRRGWKQAARADLAIAVAERKQMEAA